MKTHVVLLFEHKSSPDQNVLFQVGHYMFAHWTKCLAENRKPKPIIPVIYYQGKRSWKVGDLSDLIKNHPKEIKKYLPVINYVFIDLKTISKDHLLNIQNSMMAAAILAQQWRINPAKLQEDFERIFRLFPVEGANWNFMEMIVVYALNVSDISESQLGDTIKSIPDSIKETIMTTYTRLMEKWKTEGEQMGLQKGKVEVVYSLNEEGFEIPKIAKIVKMPEEEVIRILKNNGRLS